MTPPHDTTPGPTGRDPGGPFDAPLPHKPRPTVSSSDDPSPSATWEERQQFDAASIDRNTLARLFPEFKIVERIHHGAFGAVYSALHRKLQTPVAFKILSKQSGSEEKAYQQFLKDLELMDQLPLPGLVRTVASGERNGILFLAQEWVEGIDLASLQKQEALLAVADVCEVVRQAAETLDTVHGKGLKHLELKPAELMLVSAGPSVRVRILNLGLSRLGEVASVGFSMNLSSKFRGTVDYLAPEQIENPRGVDERADIYALGAILYKLLTGHSPHQNDDPQDSAYQKILRITREPSVPLRSRRTDLPAGLAEVVEGMMSQQAKDRPPRMSTVAALLQPFCAGHQLADLVERQPRRPLPSAPQSPSGKHRTPAMPIPPGQTGDDKRLSQIVRWLLLLAVAALAGFAAWRYLSS